ncbi:unnamed protein product [Clavelina lepadiformis]|uniref:Claudin n=1 Tax=Clavelina lepadiformis TaxID=159417 RepID=A0ABP0G6P2_CLALP
MKRSTFFGFFATLLGICGLALAAIALGTTRWRWNFADDVEYGLFERCSIGLSRNQCRTGLAEFAVPYIRATQSFMIMGAFLALIGVIVSMVIGCGKGGSKGHLAAGLLYLISGLFLMVACGVYTGVNRPLLIASGNTYRYGYSFWLAWSSSIILLLAMPFGFLANSSKFNYV